MDDKLGFLGYETTTTLTTVSERKSKHQYNVLPAIMFNLAPVEAKIFRSDCRNGKVLNNFSSTIDTIIPSSSPSYFFLNPWFLLSILNVIKSKCIACQIWLPSTHLMKAMAQNQNQRQNLAKAATKDTLEISHLKMLKWVLGVHKKNK
jgi:hypothetical protein